MTARLTVIKATRPSILSKTVERTDEGGVTCIGGGLLVEGNARVSTVSTLTDLAVLLQALSPAEALTFGVPRRGDGRILSRREMTPHRGTGATPGKFFSQTFLLIWVIKF